MEKYKKKLSEGGERRETCLLDFLRNKVLTDTDVVELLKIYFSHEVDSSIQSILGMAVVNKRTHAVEFILEKFNYPINKIDKNGSSLIHILVNNEKELFFQYLTLESPTKKISDDDVEQNENESATFVEWLMDKGVNFDHQNEEGKTALQLSIEYNLQHISRVLLKYTQNVHHYLDQHNQSLLHVFLQTNANHRGRFAVNGFSYRRYYAYTSRYAATCVKLLLDKGVSPLAYDCWDRTPLYIAIKEREDTSIVEMIIARLLERNNVATTTFVELIKTCAWWDEGRTEYFLNTLRQLVNEGANVDVKAANGATPLYWAFLGKIRKAVAFLSDCGADFGVLTGNDENLFHALARKSDVPVYPDGSTQEALFELLLEKGCTDVCAKTRSSKDTPLHFASESGNVAMVRKLVARGAEVNCKNSSGETPLHLAVHGNSAEVATFLLRNKAKVNDKDDTGRWPLYYAANSKNRVLTAKLLFWGAHVNVQIAGESPFARAIRHDCPQNAREMLAYGADINDDCVLSLLPPTNYKLTELEILLMQHWIKLRTAGLPASKKYAAIAKFKEQEKFYSECSKEVEKMRVTCINERTSTTIYAFLHVNFAKRRALMNDENFKALIHSPKLGVRFPKYAVVILASYRETDLWMSLVKPAEEAWLKLTGIRLPTECLEKILSYLRNVDLLGMIENEESA